MFSLRCDILTCVKVCTVFFVCPKTAAWNLLCAVPQKKADFLTALLMKNMVCYMQTGEPYRQQYVYFTGGMAERHRQKRNNKGT